MSRWQPIHFLNTETPHKDGTTVTVDCGDVLPNAVAVAVWEHGVAVKQLKQHSLFCKHCCLAPATDFRYLYALMDRDEAIRRGLIGEAAEVCA